MVARMVLRRGWFLLLLGGVVAGGRAEAQVFYVGPGRLVMYKVWSPYYGDQLYTYVMRPQIPYQPMYPYVPRPYRYRPGPRRSVVQPNFYVPDQRPRRYYRHTETPPDTDKEQNSVPNAAANQPPIVAGAGKAPVAETPVAESVPEPANSVPTPSPGAEEQKVLAADEKADDLPPADKRTAKRKAPRRKPTRYR